MRALLLLLGLASSPGLIMVQPPELVPGPGATPATAASPATAPSSAASASPTAGASPSPPPTAWIAAALAERLPRHLNALGVAALDSSDRQRAQEALEIPPVSVSRATAVRIAEAAGADRMVVGTYSVSGTAVTYALRILDIGRGTLSTPFMATGTIDAVPSLVQGLAFELALSGASPPTLTRAQYDAGAPAVRFDAFRAWAEAVSVRDRARRLRLLKQALSLVPEYDEARLALGRMQIEAREFTAAHETLGRVKAPDLVRTARFLQGLTLLEVGRYHEAETTYAGLAAESPTPAVLNNEALAALRGGAASRSAPLLQQAVSAAPASTDIMFNLGWALFTNGEADAAAFWLRGVRQQEPLDAHARVVLSWALRKSGRATEADEEWKGVAALSPTYAGLVKPDLSRRFERALPSERLLAPDRELRSDAEIAAALAGRADKLLEAGDAETALREATRAAYLDPYAARVHVLLSRIHRARGTLDNAENELRMALWSQDDPAIRVQLAELLLARGRIGEARTEARRVLRAQPGNAAARKVAESP